MQSNFISCVFWDNHVWERYPVLYMWQCLFTLVGRNTNYFQPCVCCKKVLVYYFSAAFFFFPSFSQPYGVPFHTYASLHSDAYLWDLLQISISLSAATSSLLSCLTISSCLSLLTPISLSSIQWACCVLFGLTLPVLLTGKCLRLCWDRAGTIPCLTLFPFSQGSQPCASCVQYLKIALSFILSFMTRGKILVVVN